MIRVAQKLGRRCRVWAVPGLPISWIRLVLALVTSVPMGLAKALIAGLAEPLQANPSRLQQLFPHALLTYEQAIDAVFAEERIEFYPPRWQDGVPAFRNFSSRHGFYGKSAKHSIRVEAPAPQLWAVVNLLGGEYRYFYMDWLWAMREWMDWCLGGSGRQHGRTNPRQLVVGDKVDSWTILSVESPHLLVMKFEMKAPGGGGMQICIDTLSSDESLLTLELHWHPAGLWGLVYWYFFAAWHQLLLHGMARNMARLARQQSPL